MRWIIGALPLILCSQLLAGETTFNGYFRTGISYSDGLTKGVCYRESVSAISNPGRFGNDPSFAEKSGFRSSVKTDCEGGEASGGDLTEARGTQAKNRGVWVESPCGRGGKIRWG